MGKGIKKYDLTKLNLSPEEAERFARNGLLLLAFVSKHVESRIEEDGVKLGLLGAKLWSRLGKKPDGKNAKKIAELLVEIIACLAMEAESDDDEIED